MAAAIEAMQRHNNNNNNNNNNNRELKFSNWNILPNTSNNPICDNRNLFNDSLVFQRNLRGVVPTSNYVSNSEISSYFNLLSRSNHETTLQQSEHKIDFVSPFENGQNQNRTMLFNTHNLNHILPALNALQSTQKPSIPITTFNSSILPDPFMIQISDNNNVFRHIGTDNSSLYSNINVTKSNDMLTLHHPILDDTNNLHYQNSVKSQSIMTTSTDTISTTSLINSRSTSQLLDAMQQQFDENSTFFINVDTKPLIPTSIELKLPVKENQPCNSNNQFSSNWPTQINNKLHSILYDDSNINNNVKDGAEDSLLFPLKSEESKSEEKFPEMQPFCNHENDKKPFLMLEGNIIDEDQADIKFTVTEIESNKIDCTHQCFENNMDNKLEKPNVTVDSSHGESINYKLKVKPCEQISNKIGSSTESNNKEKKNVPVGRVQPMIKEERQSINGNVVSLNSNSFSVNANNFDFSRILNNAATRFSTIAALNGMNQIFSSRSTYKSIPCTTSSTSLSQETVQENNNSTIAGDEAILFNCSKNSTHHILTNPVFADHSTTPVSALHQQRI